MIKVTLKRLQQSAGPLGKLAQTKNLPIAACLRIARLIRDVDAELAAAGEAHARLVKTYCKPLKSGASQGEFKNSKSEDEFKLEIKSLEAVEVELLVQPFKIRDFGIKEEDFENSEKNTIFTPQDLSLLDWLIPYAEAEEPDTPPAAEKPMTKSKTGKQAA